MAQMSYRRETDSSGRRTESKIKLYMLNNNDIDTILEFKRQELNRGCGMNVVVVIIVALIASMLAVGCKTPREIVLTDTVVVERTLHDSIRIETLVHDSVVERQRGDTVLIERWRTQYRDRWHERIRHDSIYLSRTDTIAVATPQPLTWWQQTRIHVGDIALWILVLFIIYSFYHLLLKKKVPWL